MKLKTLTELKKKNKTKKYSIESFSITGDQAAKRISELEIRSFEVM